MNRLSSRFNGQCNDLDYTIQILGQWSTFRPIIILINKFKPNKIE